MNLLTFSSVKVVRGVDKWMTINIQRAYINPAVSHKELIYIVLSYRMSAIFSQPTLCLTYAYTSSVDPTSLTFYSCSEILSKALSLVQR